MKHMRIIFLLSMSLILSVACLQTRDKIENDKEKKVLKEQMKSLQASTANSTAQMQEINDEFRRLYGKIEAVEAYQNRQRQGQSNQTKSLQEQVQSINEKQKIFQEAIGKLDEQMKTLIDQMNKLTNQVNIIGARKASAKKKVNNSSKVPKGNFAAGQYHFKRKNWIEAAQAYEKYRSMNPGGRRFALATLNIGISFQNAGDPEGAKSFYNELIKKYPKSGEAKTARNLLKKLK